MDVNALRKVLLLPFLLFSSLFAEGFNVVVLGCTGGPLENNLSCYLVAPSGSNDYIALDAGTLLSGIVIANKKGSFRELSVNEGQETTILRDHVKGYLISHAHLDHVAALIINSPVDSKKPIYGIDRTIEIIRDNLFNWRVWPNFASSGKKPWVNKYHYTSMEVEKPLKLEKTGISATPFLLSHPGEYPSTAFLLEHSKSYLLYLGDTSPDCLEKTKHLHRLWELSAPLVKQKMLRALFIECSYSDSRKEEDLFGHLTPGYVIKSLKELAKRVDPQDPERALNGLKVVVTHIKETSVYVIKRELEAQNGLGVEFIFPVQGERLIF